MEILKKKTSTPSIEAVHGFIEKTGWYKWITGVRSELVEDGLDSYLLL